jgi:hypothetical protein
MEFTTNPAILLENLFAKFVNSSDAVAYCGKDKLDENAVIQPGQNVEFHRRAGEKG